MKVMESIGCTLLKEAKRWIVKAAVSGEIVKCPCCNQPVKLYRRKLNSGIARFLIYMHNITAGDPFRWVHIGRELIEEKTCQIARDYSILRFWGLLEPGAPGFWRLTPAGVDFVENKGVVPKVVFIYNNECIKKGSDVICIEDALGDKFDHAELMKGEL